MNKNAIRLRKAADSCIKQAEKTNTEISGGWTHRRQRFADHAAKKKETFEARARVLSRLADEWDAGNVPEHLQFIRSAGDIDFVMFSGFPTPPDKDTAPDGWYMKEYPTRKKKADRIGITSSEVASKMRDDLVQYAQFELSPQMLKERELKEAIVKLRGVDIPGFFPTPDKLIDLMIDHAQLHDGLTVLEPSAGIGSILDRIVFHGYICKMLAVERQHSLVNICRLKGYNTVDGDIMGYTNFSDAKEQHSMVSDRIIMNPPFERGQDVQHIIHCFTHFLNPGGILVAIASAGILTNEKIQGFRDFISRNSGEVIINGQEFKEAFRSTGVATVTIVLHKPL